MKPFWLAPILAMALTINAQVPNPSFEQGSGAAPDKWKLSAPTGEWATGGHTGSRSVSVTGTGEDSNHWRCDDVELLSSELYRLSFYARCTPGATGSIISGPQFANRDMAVSEAWDRRSFVFATPTVVPSNSFLRLGQWHLKGTVSFDDVTLQPVMPVHAHSSGLELGEGESTLDGTYRFRSQFSADGGNFSRPLEAHTAGFNSDRWVFGPESYVVYKHRAGSHTQRNGKLTLNLGHYQSGRCMIEMSFDGLTWTSVDELTGTGEKNIDLPSKLYPAGMVYIRLRADKISKDDPRPPSFQISEYGYEAGLMDICPNVRGWTYFAEVVQQDKLLTATCESLGDPLPGGDHNTLWRLRNDSDATIKTQGQLELWQGNKLISKSEKTLNLMPGHGEIIELGYNLNDAGDYELRFIERDLQKKKEAFGVRIPFNVPLLFASGYGWRLSDEKEKVGLWWCESTRKIDRSRPMPTGNPRSAIQISAARNESESFQLALNPHKSASNVVVNITELRGPHGAKIPRENISIYRVGYVQVTTPTDAMGVPAEWPDPLPPLRADEALQLHLGQNTPLWFTVTVPENIPSGDYTGRIELQEKPRTKFDKEIWKSSVTLILHVWNFSLPKETRLKTAFGISPAPIKQYHLLETPEELASVWEKYMQNFAAHHIAPYWPMGTTDIGVEFDKSASPVRVKLDFSKFDPAARHCLDELGFSTFRLPLHGLGSGGQGNPHIEGEFGGFKQGTPDYETLWGDYARQLADHLEQNGWLRKAYLYWFDEPHRSDYGFVRRNNDQIRKLAPKLTRMLTEQPEPELTGAVDIWCPVSYNYRPESCQQRQKAGEHIWWYVCCGPKAPYCTLFIDHPAVELRTWLWQTWGYGVEGILIWETNWWNQPARFKAPESQDPWEDPMSYSATGMWGNGDGRFFYPPYRANKREPARKSLDGPVNSIRWEILRDGVEDYEYLALLRDLLKTKTDAEAATLLKVPASIYTDMTHFNYDPAPILEQRERIARAIERLTRK